MRVGLDDSYLQAFLNQCPLLRDQWSQSFYDYHVGRGGLLNWFAILELVLLICFTRTNSARLESLNALLRRIIGTRYQSRSMSFVSLCSKFCLSRVKVRERELALGHKRGNRPTRKKRVKKRIAKTKHKRVGGGGPFRAYMSKELRRCRKQCWKLLCQSYRDLIAEENKSL